MKIKKIIILAVTISFPVLLYLFLRFFGQNSYNLPVYFEGEGIACSDDSIKNHQMFIDLANRQDTLQLTDIFNAQELRLVIFPSSDRDNQPFKNELSRAFQALQDRVPLQLIALYPSKQSLNILQLEEYDIQAYSALEERFNQLLSCNFKLPSPDYKGLHPTEESWPVNECIVLIDQKQNIRGYFNGFETKDVDRLILEINVLLSSK